MATRCPRCEKKSMKVTKRKLLRGHYNPTKVYRQKPNLQWALVDGKRMKICTDCIKTLYKTAAQNKKHSQKKALLTPRNSKKERSN